MKNFFVKWGAFLLFCALFFSMVELSAASKDEVKAMVKKVEAYYKANGREKTFAEVQKDKGQFEKGELYVYIFDMNATVLAHPKLPSWVGKSFINLKDADGKFFIKEALDKLKTQKECWIDYKWNNPETKKIGLKHGYFLKVDDFVLSCGIWE
ncbi:MAG: Cache domain protein [Spirochaetes bacterium ADurb.Bin218]|nr:MAG: Cache domain protein [Spirochaetes bacterium ADurb.Bin218]HPX90472.1 cache domain-containing protein [Spirochaetota bacterium]